MCKPEFHEVTLLIATSLFSYGSYEGQTKKKANETAGEKKNKADNRDISLSCRDIYEKNYVLVCVFCIFNIGQVIYTKSNNQNYSNSCNTV